MQRMSDGKSVGSDGGRAGILAQKPASGESSEGFGRRASGLVLVGKPYLTELGKSSP